MKRVCLAERGLQPASTSICEATLKRRERRAPYNRTLPAGERAWLLTAKV
jgi:hypothetical protein